MKMRHDIAEVVGAAMHVTWIIGNGFDLNLGLNTSYWDFYTRCYQRDEKCSRDAKELNGRLSNRFDNPELLWGDLELLLGVSSEFFNASELDEYNEIFNNMQLQLGAYLEAEVARLTPDSLLKKDIELFRTDIVDLERHLAPAYKDRMGDILHRAENMYCNFVSLNYTNVLDSYLKAARSENGTLRRRGSYFDMQGELLHLHGQLGATGGMVFGLSNEGQFRNSEFAQNEAQKTLWVKPERNMKLHANNRTREAIALIKKSTVICLFGVSLGETDQYLWNELGKRLAGSRDARVILYVHDLPKIGSPDALEAYRARQRAEATFFRACGWDGETGSKYVNQLILQPSCNVFAFKPKLAANTTYPVSKEDAG